MWTTDKHSWNVLYVYSLLVTVSFQTNKTFCVCDMATIASLQNLLSCTSVVLAFSRNKEEFFLIMNNKSWSASILLHFQCFFSWHLCLWLRAGLFITALVQQGDQELPSFMSLHWYGCPLQYVYCGNSYCKNNKKAIQLCNLAFLRFHGCYVTTPMKRGWRAHLETPMTHSTWSG